MALKRLSESNDRKKLASDTQTDVWKLKLSKGQFHAEISISISISLFQHMSDARAAIKYVLVRS